MNAAARLVHQNTLTRHLVMTHLLTRKQLVVFLLLLAVLMSSLGVIYATQMTRVFHAGYQRNLIEQDHLQMEKGQLLLERSALMVQARVQQIAEKKLGMILPDHQSFVVVRD